MKGRLFQLGLWPLILLYFFLLGAAPMESTRTSRALFSPEREVTPTIQITGTQVSVQHRATGSGKIRGTALRGRRTYEFKKSGTYTVEPGTYTHIVYGQVPSGGTLESTIRYQ